MSWFSSLFKKQCSFCGKQAALDAWFCEACLALQLGFVPSQITLSFNPTHCLDLWFLGKFEGNFQDQIRRQKKFPSSHFTHFAAQTLFTAMPPDWRKARLLWVPTRTFQHTHLVEHLALSFRALGMHLLPRPKLQRSLLSTQKQKEQTLAERKNQNRFRTRAGLHDRQTAQLPVVLLDDVVTSGSTLYECASLATAELGAHVLGALSLAYTPLGSKQRTR